MAKKVKQTAYQAAAAEFNDVMGMDPEIDVTLSDDELKPILVKAIGMIDPEDEFSDETQEVIDELKPKKGKKPVKEEAPAAPAKKGKKAPEHDPEDEEEEEEEDSDDDDEEEDDEPAPVKKPAKKEASAPAKKEAKKDDKKKSDEPKKKGNFVAAEYNRVDAVCDALKAKPKTVAAWSEKADSLLEAKGGKANANENKFIIRYFQKMAKHFDFGGVTVPMV